MADGVRGLDQVRRLAKVGVLPRGVDESVALSLLDDGA